ncbi:MAG: SDR family oxidoreductase [Candidatus Thorarchaeota archaeon]
MINPFPATIQYIYSQFEQGIKNFPLGRFGTAEEVAQRGLFLACDESSFVTGSVIVVDGGFLTL